MRSAIILFKDEEAGILTQHDDGSFTFSYHPAWQKDTGKPSISLTLPKARREFHSGHLFPFFYNMLPEGSNKQIICKAKRIDADDHFSLLMSIAQHDTIGAVRVIKQ
ncbi:MAG: HipA N-terminal domain-containing protein [Bacteroidetes bacterium]|jgi:HipA-like protein|nr:HipA N-terminal domain-containing protein [Bacteroidota bacterium]